MVARRRRGELDQKERNRMIHSLKLRGLIGLSFMGAAASGCAPSAAPGGAPALVPAATIIVDGSSTVFRISKAAQEGFNKVDPSITVVVDNHGTGGGFGRYQQGEVDIVDASRPAKADEEAKAKEAGIEWERFVVGYDGITLVINQANDFVKSLTVAQLKAIWSPGSTINSWKDVDPTWPARKILFYSPDNDSGTFDFFTEAIVGKQKSQRDDVQQSADDNTLVSGVAGDRDGLGYFGYAYYAANKDKLRAVAVQNGPTAMPVLPSNATIADKSYAPLSRPLFIYVKRSAAKRPEVAKFVKYYIENVAELAAQGGYDPPTAEDKTANQEVLAKLTGGGAGEPAAPTAASK
jgi:phosphate transport system substrate-binding protein